MDEAFIVVSVISGLFGIIGLMLLDRNWFRRERFKFERDTLRKENDLKFKKMAKDLGLTPPLKSTSLSNPGLLETAGSLLPILNNLGPEKIGDLVGLLTSKSGGRSEAAASLPTDDDESPDTTDMLLDFAANNPEIAKKILDGVVEGLGEAKGSGGKLPADLH